MEIQLSFQRNQWDKKGFWYYVTIGTSHMYTRKNVFYASREGRQSHIACAVEFLTSVCTIVVESKSPHLYPFSEVVAVPAQSYFTYLNYQ